MIKPHPESDLALNAVILGAEIIDILKKNNREMVVDDLLNKFLKKEMRRTPELFLQVIILLFSTGVIDREQYKIKLIKGRHA